MTSTDIYRSCASIVVLRPIDMTGTTFEVLLVHKPRKNDAWQLPQGGVEEGESIAEAALRELQEEAGITAEIIAESDKVYQYDFPKSYRRFRPDNVCGQRLRFVIASTDMQSKVIVDGEEIDTYAWVHPEALDDYMTRDEYKSIVVSLIDKGIAILQS